MPEPAKDQNHLDSCFVPKNKSKVDVCIFVLTSVGQTSGHYGGAERADY